MLDQFVKKDRKERLAFNVNMLGNVRTLHINSEIVGPGKKEIFSKKGKLLPYKKCPYQFSDEYIPFNSLEDVEAFEKAQSCPFKRCGFCFPKDMRGN